MENFWFILLLTLLLIPKAYKKEKEEENKMKTIRIELDYMDGPIWKDFYDATTKSDTTGVPVVDNDEKLKSIAQEISNMFDS